MSETGASTHLAQPPDSQFKKWMIAARLFSLPASLLPVIFGGLLAAVYGRAGLDLFHLLLSVVAMALLHGAANMLNDCCDYRLGLDDLISPGSGAVVRGVLSSRQVLAAAVVLFAAGIAIGLYLALQTSLLVLVIGLIGVVIGIAYSTGPYPLKHHALGDLAVFMAFGILGSLGAWVVQAGQIALMPVLWAVPLSLYIIAILHANNWRDVERDRRKDVTTVAGMLGQRAYAYYIAMILSPFAVVIVFIFAPWFFCPSTAMSPLFLITLLALPKAFSLSKTALDHHRFPQAHSIDDLDARSAQLSLMFGTLCIIAVILDALI